MSETIPTIISHDILDDLYASIDFLKSEIRRMDDLLREGVAGLGAQDLAPLKDALALKATRHARHPHTAESDEEIRGNIDGLSEAGREYVAKIWTMRIVRSLEIHVALTWLRDASGESLTDYVLAASTRLKKHHDEGGVIEWEPRGKHGVPEEYEDIE